MRIAFLNAYGNGSTGRIVDKLKEICESNGMEVLSIFARETCARNDATTINSLNKWDFYLDAFLSRVADNHGLNSIYSTKRVIEHLVRFKPDLIHLHNLHGYWINYKMLFDYIKRNDIKVVWTFHDCWNFTGHCTHFDFVKCDKWMSGCYNCPQLKEYPASVGYDGSKRNYISKRDSYTGVKNLVIVTPSEWMKSKVEKSFLSGYEVKIINNGIDINVFKPCPDHEMKKAILSNGFDKVILGVAATWNERKGLRDILTVAGKEPNWFFVVIGTVPDQSILRNQYANVHFIDRTDNVQTLAKWYSTADVLANPTREDTYPTINLEAMACGCPVVSYATGGSVEIIKNYGLGILTKQSNSEFLRDAIHLLFERGSVSLNKNLSLDAQDKFKEYMDLYNSLK